MMTYVNRISQGRWLVRLCMLDGCCLHEAAADSYAAARLRLIRWMSEQPAGSITIGEIYPATVQVMPHTRLLSASGAINNLSPEAM